MLQLLYVAIKNELFAMWDSEFDPLDRKQIVRLKRGSKISSEVTKNDAGIKSEVKKKWNSTSVMQAIVVGTQSFHDRLSFIRVINAN